MMIPQGSERTMGVWRAGLSRGISNLVVKIPRDSGTCLCSP